LGLGLQTAPALRRGYWRHTLGYFLPRRPTWRRLDPSSSPSANDPRISISLPMDRPKISQQSGAFQQLRLYLRLPSCAFLGAETAFFSRASYFVYLVQFGKVKGESNNLQRTIPAVRIALGRARATRLDSCEWILSRRGPRGLGMTEMRGCSLQLEVAHCALLNIFI
jgi:hypothetical protein